VNKNYLSIDIGGTKIKSAVIDRSGNILTRGRMDTPKNLTEFLTGIETIVEDVHGSIRGIAVSTPGKVNPETGTISFGGALPFLDGVSLKQLLAKYQVPLAVTNDGKAAALAEWWLGNLKGIQNGAAITLGTGLGGGVIVEGKLIQGAHFQAGELSFLLNATKRSDAPENAEQPNNQGLTLQQLAGFSGSAVAMIRRSAQLLGLADLADGEAVFDAINQKEPRVWALFTAYCREIACVILNVQAVIDLDRFVIGGGISAQAIVVEEIDRQYQQLLASLPILQQTLTKPEIQACKFQNDANLLGALYHFFLEHEMK